MNGEVELRSLGSSKHGERVAITDLSAKEKFRRAAMNDLLASVEMRDREARINDKDCFKRPLE